MGKTEAYREALRGMDTWNLFLLEESNLPGPRANLELAFAVASEGDAPLFLRYAAMGEEVAPQNTREEFLAFCGTLGLGYAVARGDETHLPLIKKQASDPRWRIREAVALGLQEWGRADMGALVTLMEEWAEGNPLEKRAAVATLCHPELLRDAEHAARVFDLLDRVTSSLLDAGTLRGDAATLGKALGYGWSVAVAAQPDAGMPRMEKWIGSGDPAIRRIMKENLRKKRLVRLDEAWVDAQRAKINER